MSAKLVALEKFDQHSTFKIGVLCLKHIKGNKGNKGIQRYTKVTTSTCRYEL